MRCGLNIYPGSGVVVYNVEGGFIRDAFRTPGGGYLGCLRMKCCPSGGLFAGHWMGYDRGGFRPAFNGGSAAEEAFRTGKTVIVNLK